MIASNSAKEADGHEDDGFDQLERAVDRDSQNAKRQQKQPDERIKHQGQQGQRPAENEENAPQKKLDHLRPFTRRLEGFS